MIVLPAADFITRFATPWQPQDHHHTGPANAHQFEGQGSVTHEEGTLLAAFAAANGGPVLEIGGDLGISTRYIWDGLDNYRVGGAPEVTGQVWSVDPMHKWDPRDFPDIKHFHCKSIDGWRKPTPGNPDGQRFVWAFIDGDHRYAGVIRDISVAIAAGCDDLIFHDTSPYFHGKPTNASDGSEARAAVQDYLEHTGEWELYDIPTRCGLVYARRK